MSTVSKQQKTSGWDEEAVYDLWKIATCLLWNKKLHKSEKIFFVIAIYQA